MSWFRNLETVTKLMAGFGVVVAVIIVVGYIGVRDLGRINDMLGAVYERHTIGVAAAKQVSVDLMMIAREIRQPLIENDASRVAQYAQNVDRYESELRRNLDIVRRGADSEQEKARLADVDRTVPVYLGVARQILKLAGEGNRAAAVAELGQARETVGRAVEAARALGDLQVQEAKKAHEEASELYNGMRGVMLGLVLGGALLAAGIAALVARVIVQPLGGIVGVLDELAQAEGGLTKRLAVQSTDEVGDLAKHTSAATEQLSPGAQEGASSLEETAASLEEITGTVRQSADSARQASQLAVTSRDTGDRADGGAPAHAPAAPGHPVVGTVATDEPRRAPRGLRATDKPFEPVFESGAGNGHGGLDIDGFEEF
jgi:methyl-accepting chemotaxis protein